MAGSGQSMPWSDAEDRLLYAIVHEFGSNWFRVADVLSASCAMQGIYRSPTTCRYRFRNLTVRGPFSAAVCTGHFSSLPSPSLTSAGSSVHKHGTYMSGYLASAALLHRSWRSA